VFAQVVAVVGGEEEVGVLKLARGSKLLYQARYHLV
jgi:hypothetical protein